MKLLRYVVIFGLIGYFGMMTLNVMRKDISFTKAYYDYGLIYFLFWCLMGVITFYMNKYIERNKDK